MNKKELMEKFQEQTGYRFKDDTFLEMALTHSSYANEMHLNKLHCNERLEFLGDAVLECISSEFVYTTNPQLQEGDLTKLRASFVCEPTLALCAKDIHLGDFIFLGKGERMTGGAGRESILSDALEAVIGAVYLDGGFTSAKEFIERHILADIDKKKLFFDSKTILQEIVQSHFEEPLHYEIVDVQGPDHNRRYTAAVYIGPRRIATGEGGAKKSSEQVAAYQAILKLGLEYKTKGRNED